MFLLTAENLDYIVGKPAPKEPANDADDETKEDYQEEMKEWTKDNKKARIFILGSMSDSLASEYESEVTAYKIMSRLEQDYGEVSLVRVLSLVNRVLNTKMTEGGSVNEHLNKLCVVNEELRIAGYPFSEEVQVMIALNSLPHTWEQFKMSFCHSERVINMRNLRYHLHMEEDRKSSQGKDKHSQNHELHLGEERRRWQKGRQGGDLRDKINRKRGWDDHANKGANSDFDKRNFRCHGCGDSGHFRKDCPKKKKVYKPNEKPRMHHQDKRHDRKKDNSSPDGTCDLFVCSESLFTTSASDHWVVDSGSTSHIARNSDCFTSLTPIPKGTRFIYLGTTAKADILGIVDYVLKLPK
jgi:hypothetical protein